MLEQPWLHRKVQLEKGRPVLGDVAGSSLFGKVRSAKYEKANLPEGMSGTGVESAEFLRANFHRMDEYLQKNHPLTREQQAERIRYKRALYSLPLIHFTRKRLDEIQNGKLVSHEIISETSEHSIGNTYDHDIRTGRNKFVYFSLGNMYMGNNGHTQTFTAMFIDGTKLKEPHFVVQADGLNKIFQQETKEREPENYDHLNQVSLIGEDFVNIASHCLAAGIMEYDDINRSEIMVRDGVDLSEFDAIYESDSNDEVNEMTQTGQKTFEIPEALMYGLQFDIYKRDNWTDPTSWHERITNMESTHPKQN